MDPGEQVKTDANPFDTGENASGAEVPSPPDNFVNARVPRSRVELPSYMEKEMREEGIKRPAATKQPNNPVSEKPKPVIIRHVHESLPEAGRPELKVYQMKSRPKGLFLCLNNIEFEGCTDMIRKGAEKDELNLKTIFYKLGYRVHSFRDQDAQSMKDKITQFKNRSELHRVDSIIVAVMSHGEGSTETYVLGSDRGLVPCQWIIEQFNAANCPAMHNKPKVFLFQLCRGDKPDIYVSSPRTTEQDGLSQSDASRLNGDVFKADATIQGHAAHRHSDLGSWFVQAICRAYTQHACDRDLEDLHKIVDGHMKKCISDNPSSPSMQTSCYENRAFSKFYFMPGVYN